MYTIAIDESNTHQQTGKSTIVLVYVLTKNATKLEEKILRTEKQLKILPFHWARHDWLTKEKFIRSVKDCDFSIKVALIKNPIKSLPKALEWLLQHLITEQEINKIIIDGKKPKWYSRQLKKLLRDKHITVKKLNTVNSKSYPLIRLADCLAGIIRYYYNNSKAKDAKRLFNLIKNKIALQMEGQRTG